MTSPSNGDVDWHGFGPFGPWIEEPEGTPCSCTPEERDTLRKCHVCRVAAWYRGAPERERRKAARLAEFEREREANAGKPRVVCRTCSHTLGSDPMYCNDCWEAAYHPNGR